MLPDDVDPTPEMEMLDQIQDRLGDISDTLDRVAKAIESRETPNAALERIAHAADRVRWVINYLFLCLSLIGFLLAMKDLGFPIETLVGFAVATVRQYPHESGGAMIVLVLLILVVRRLWHEYVGVMPAVPANA